MSKSKYVFRSDNGSKFVSASNDHKTIRKIGRESARSAIRESHKYGLSVTYIKGDRIIREDPDGKKVVIGYKTGRSHTSSVSKGDVLRVKKD